MSEPGAAGRFRALVGREIGAFFLSPMTYLAWMVFLVAAGYFFATTLRDGGSASLSRAFTSMAMLLVFVAPLLTMRLVAEELKLGTLEVLLSDPVGEATVVLAKYVAALVFFLVMLCPTAAFPALLAAFGQPDPGPVVAGYLGLALLGALFLAVGLLGSALTANQVAAAAVSFTVLLLFWALGRAAAVLEPGPLRDALDYLSAFSRYAAFRRGVVDTRSVVYCASLTGLSLFLAVRLLGLRRLR